MVELPPGYIDPDITGQDRALLEAFYIGVYSEGGTADEVNLRGIRAVMAAAQGETGADGPAVQGREPTSAPRPRPRGRGAVVEPIRALLAEMADELDHDRQCLMDDRRLTHPLADRARAVLAAAQPAPPVEGEVAKLAAEIRHFLAGYRQMRGLDPEYVYSIHRGGPMEAHIKTSRLARAAELLAQAHPTPVSKSHPTNADCDRAGRCWWFDPHNGGAWYYDTFQWLYSHWLPAGAMPRPGLDHTTTETTDDH